MFAALVRDPGVARHDWGSLRWCISGASALSPEAAALFRERTGAQIIQGYGLTEAAPVTHVNPAAGERRAGSIGVPLPRTRCRIVDLERGERELPVGEAGELTLSGPQVMAGYWHMPEETARTLRGGWLYTGDIARVDSEGYYYIVDRKKEMIITAGFNVYPSEVESAILEIGGVREAAVIGLPDPLRGEQVAAYLVLHEGVELTAQQVREHCRARLAAYKVPRLVRFRAELPKSLIGKVLKRELKRQEMEGG
jgi:long-chain acyl-CoA synthetase